MNNTNPKKRLLVYFTCKILCRTWTILNFEFNFFSQGAVSTILGVIGLAFAPSYLFVTFFKMIFLVIVLGLLHGMILLPVLLSLFGPGMCSSSKNSAGSSSKSTRSSGLSTPNIAIISGHKTRSGKGNGNALSMTAAAKAGHSAISADSGCCSYTVNLVSNAQKLYTDRVSYFLSLPKSTF